MSARISANQAVCIGSGQCVFSDPDVFDQDDIGKVMVLIEHPSEGEQMARAREAVHVCPSRALTLSEDS